MGLLSNFEVLKYPKFKQLFLEFDKLKFLVTFSGLQLIYGRTPNSIYLEVFRKY